MRSAAVLPGQFVPDDGVSAHYRLGRTGDWEVPSNVDRNNPHVRLLLVTPTGPLIVELAIFVDGRPFRTTREEWIDEVLATKESSEKSPASLPVSETTPNSSDKPDKSTGVSAAVYEQSRARERLRQYVQQSRIAVSRDEARWLLAEWVPGPALLQLRHDFAADRSSQAPLWAALDEDGDRRLSFNELRDLTTRLRARDTNEDEWVDLSELTDGRSPLVRCWTPQSLGTILWEFTDWGMLHRELVELYGSNSNRAEDAVVSRLLATLNVSDLKSLRTEDLRQLLEISPDVAVRINLATAESDDNQTGVAVLGLSEPLQEDHVQLQAAEDVIALAVSGCVVELSAAQRKTAGEGWNAQIAVGTVLDGFPLLRLIDADQDHRLSLREIESLPEMLVGFDENGDGELTFGEVPVPMRLTVTLGPHTHDVLNRPAAASLIERSAKTPAPEWFASMDENKDNDLTPAEFLGTREQFDQLDNDGNGRINSREAAAATALKP